MWSSGSSAPLRIEPRRSWLLAAALAGVYTAAAAVLAGLPWPFWARLLSLGLLAVHGGWNLRRHWLKPPVQVAVWGTDGGWRLRLEGGWQSARAEPHSWVSRGLAILHFRLESGRRVTFLVLPDAVPAAVRRRLVLRWRATGAAEQ